MVVFLAKEMIPAPMAVAMIVKNISSLANILPIGNRSFPAGGLLDVKNSSGDEIRFSFRGNDHFSIRFPDKWNLEPFRVKLGSDIEYNAGINMLIINSVIGIRL